MLRCPRRWSRELRSWLLHHGSRCYCHGPCRPCGQRGPIWSAFPLSYPVASCIMYVCVFRLGRIVRVYSVNGRESRWYFKLVRMVVHDVISAGFSGKIQMAKKCRG